MTTATYPLTFPADAGTSGQWLLTNASNAVYWGLGNFGALIQVVSTQTGSFASGSTSIPYDNTIPQNTEGNEYMSLAITPTSSTNLLLIKVNTFFSGNGAGADTDNTIALFQDSTANALAASPTTRTNTSMTRLCINYPMVAGTTSSTTFKVRAGRGAAQTTNFNGRSGAGLFGGTIASSIIIKEFKI